MTQVTHQEPDEAKLNCEHDLPGTFGATDGTEDGGPEGQADALTELTETDTLEVTKMNPKTDAEFDEPATASTKDPEGPGIPNLGKPDEAPKADTEAEVPDTPATAPAEDRDGTSASNSGKPAEAPRADAEPGQTPATASAKDPDGPEIPNLAKPDEAPKA